MGEIYKIINDFNNQVYIGKTMKNTEARKREHLAQLDDNSAIHQSIKKHGIEHFTWVVIESNIFDKKILAERQQYWIAQYDSYYHGYNMTKGGEGGNGTHAANLQKWREQNPDLVQQSIQKLIQWNLNHTEEKKEINKHAAETRKAKYGKNITQKANEATRKKVRCLETNIIYNSATEAALAVGGANASNISKACTGRAKTAYKYHWEYI